MARKAKKVRCIETGEVYNSCAEAGRAVGINHSSINNVALGKQESVKGLHFEFVEENEPELGVIPVTVTNEQGETVPVIDSREVARMMGKQHKEILVYIEGSITKDRTHTTGILPTLLSNGIDPSAYFIESSYTTAINNREKCYLCTRMGCDLLATRQKGEKGILFCAKYVERFNAMEKELKKNNPALSKEDDLLLAIVKGATPLDRATALQEYTALITDKATAPLKGTIAEQQAELTQVTTELTEKTEFIDDINDCFPISQIVKDNKQLLRDRKDIVICPAKLNRTASELNIPVNKIDNPNVYSPYRRINAYPRKVWMTAYPDIKLPEKESK